ncbi:hypothetical protein ACFQS2_12730 [Brachybacterium sp. GCM10030267]|uniref:hypothetical protein n=1 Tax=Brachybacterium sp. GCM10030267 TaxID=3273381 RepID=UPI0036136374
MSSIMRTTVRRAAAGLGVLAIAAGAGACTGGDEGETGGQETASQESDPEATREDTGPSDGGGEAASDAGSGENAGEVGEQDVSAAKEQMIGFIQALGDKDAEAACGFVLDPATDQPVEGASATACVETITDSDQYQALSPQAAAMVTEDMLEADPRDDGTIAISVPGIDTEVPMARGDDGSWYIKAL